MCMLPLYAIHFYFKALIRIHSGVKIQPDSLETGHVCRSIHCDSDQELLKFQIKGKPDLR